jgi:hypothetical protein
MKDPNTPPRDTQITQLRGWYDVDIDEQPFLDYLQNLAKEGEVSPENNTSSQPLDNSSDR